MFSKKTTLFIKWTELPDDIKQLVRDRFERFQNDVFINFHSEFEPCAGEGGSPDWSWLTDEGIEEYYREQQEPSEYKDPYEGTLEDFIRDYGLTLEKWLIDTKVDLAGVEKILFEIAW